MSPVDTTPEAGVATRALHAGFLDSAERHPERPALEVGGETLTYAALRERAERIAATLQAHPSGTPLTAVFAYRSAAAFAGVLGSLLAGHGYVPLNRTFPLTRTQRMLESSGCGSVIVDRASLSQLEQLLEHAERPLLVIAPELDDVAELAARWPRHTFAGEGDLAPAASRREPDVGPDDIAYLLFTSGSTGMPKGVMVAQRNVRAFVDYMVDRYEVRPDDRFTQMFDMTFDLSVFDMFVCWERGACLCCPGQKELISPGRFLQHAQPTVWFSVPSTAVFMKRLGLLRAGRYRSLRLSLFCGEPLPVQVAQAWLEATPDSIVENLYGPTELTIATTLYRWDPARSLAESELDIVPIGQPYPGMRVLVVDDELREVAPGETGELLMNGPQMTPGYWKDAGKTAAAFVTPPGRGERFYRTGDRVRRPANDGPLTHLGRTDFQVKVRGHRVELGEIEAAVRRLSGLDGVVAVGWPASPSGYDGIEVFIEGAGVDAAELRGALAAELPDYMVPRRFHVLERLPKNVNDKFDRKAMAGLLEEGL
jgi:amino acid adenylation domain-containing protein